MDDFDVGDLPAGGKNHSQYHRSVDIVRARRFSVTRLRLLKNTNSLINISGAENSVEIEITRITLARITVGAGAATIARAHAIPSTAPNAVAGSWSW